MNSPPSEKSRAVALALCIPLGVFGAHRFYAGKIGTGILQLCTMGGFGLWWLFDLITIASGEFRDVDGRRISLWDPADSPARLPGVPQELLDEVDALRREVSELAERVDFAERLLADPARRAADAPRSGTI
jgi:TM2 domain-containing membrane protein YozV